MFPIRLARRERGAVNFPFSIIFPATLWLIAVSRLVAVKVMVLFSASMRIFFKIGRLVFSPADFSITEIASLMFERMAMNFMEEVVVVLIY